MLSRDFALLTTYLKRHWLTLILLAVLLLCTVAIQVGNPHFLRVFIDSASAGSPLQLLLLTAGCYLFFGVLNQGLVVATAYVSGSLAWTTTNQLRLDLVRHCLYLEMSFHHDHSPGELLERTDEDVSLLANLFSLFVLQVLVNLLLLIVVLVIFWVLDWRLGSVMLAYSLLCLWIFRRTNSFYSSSWEAVFQAKAELHGFVGEQVTALPDIRTSGAIPYVLNRFYTFRRKAFLSHWDAHVKSTVLSGSTDILLICGSVGAFLLAVALQQKGVLSIGMVYVVVTYTQLLSQPLQEILTQFDDLRQARASLSRIHDLLTLHKPLPDGTGIPLPSGPLSVTFDNISFAYHASQPVLQQVSFSIAPGTVLALVGRTGSGKTTIARLLLRFYDPTSGSIRLANQDIHEARKSDLRQRVALVTQNVHILHASLRDNLTFFADEYADEQLLAALATVGLSSWYAALPRGLDTLISSQSTAEAGLSAGEAQLLSLARVFLRDPSLVILDEASSRLDLATEQVLDVALQRLCAGRTVLLIAHRLSTLARADSVLVLDQGHVCEYGPYTRLLADTHSRLHYLFTIGSEHMEASV